MRSVPVHSLFPRNARQVVGHKTRLSHLWTKGRRLVGSGSARTNSVPSSSQSTQTPQNRRDHLRRIARKTGTRSTLSIPPLRKSATSRQARSLYALTYRTCYAFQSDTSHEELQDSGEFPFYTEPQMPNGCSEAAVETAISERGCSPGTLYTTIGSV